MKATNIQWDVDGPKDLENLPSVIEIPIDIDLADDDAVSNYITNLTGFCHKGFDLVGDAVSAMPLHAQAYVLEQPEDDHFKGAMLQGLMSVLDPKADYLPLMVEGNNSAAIVMVDQSIFEGMLPSAEPAFIREFRRVVRKTINDMPEESPDRIYNIGGIRTFWMRSLEDLKGPSEWLCTDDDCAQYLRRINADSFELYQVCKMPDETYRIAHAFIYLSDYDEAEREDIISSYGYVSWENLIMECMGDVSKAEQFFAEGAFETNALESLTEVDYDSFEAAETRIKELIAL